MVQVEELTGREAYVSLLAALLRHGEKTGSRLGRMLEVEHLSVSVRDPERASCLGMGRKLSPAIIAMETLQLVAGRQDADLLCRVAPAFEAYREPGADFHGSYGDRTRLQMRSIVSLLRAKPDSRQAVVNIWSYSRNDLGRETWGGKDCPCTVALQFRVRGGRLNLSVFMRSNDAWLGFPYDLAMFTGLQCSVAACLCLAPGTYYHTAGSMHLYEGNWAAAEELLAAPRGGAAMPLSGLGGGAPWVNGVQWYNVQERAWALMHGEPQADETASETWYRESIAAKLC